VKTAPAPRRSTWKAARSTRRSPPRLRALVFVTEETNAWHAGNGFFCNPRSVGIEHVGYFDRPYPDRQYAASARLVGHLLAKYGVAADRAHLVGHDQVPNPNVFPSDAPPCVDASRTCWASGRYGGRSRHPDPGLWEWPTYMPRVGGQAKCSDATTLWSCASDRTSAFRCAAGVVEVRRCAGGCRAADAGADVSRLVARTISDSNRTWTNFNWICRTCGST